MERKGNTPKSTPTSPTQGKHHERIRAREHRDARAIGQAIRVDTKQSTMNTKCTHFRREKAESTGCYSGSVVVRAFTEQSGAAHGNVPITEECMACGCVGTRR